MVMKLTFVLSVIYATGVYYLAACEEKCFTQTVHGSVRGKSMASRNGNDFCAFLGIQFAAPPTGKLRFMPPEPPEPWEGVKDCREESKECIQKEPGGSEDCLYVNVFTRSAQSNTSLPVMVYIHGGGFYMGSSSLSWLGPEYLMDKDIVLVTLQYRLGPFGFLSTEDDVIPGNMGLKDQVKALQWVQENIESFGGDTHKVTIFGNSAGGASVHYHMMSAVSKSLFARAISQSGTAMSSFALMGKGKPKKDVQTLGEKLNCSFTSSREILYCLQNKEASEILREYLKLLPSQFGYRNKLFRPVVEVQSEHAFLTENPAKLRTEKPWLVGLNAKEGLWKIDDRINETIDGIQTDFKNNIPFTHMFADLFSNLDEITNITYRFYFENAPSFEEKAESLEQILTDSWFAWPTELAISHHDGPLHYYLYDHTAQYTYSQMYGLKPLHRGAIHTDELLMLFTQKGTFPPVRGEDLNISKLLVQLWTSFAAEGDPTPHPIRSNPQFDNSELVTWRKSANSHPDYFHIKTHKLTMESELFLDRMNFWRGVSFKNVGGE